MKVTLRKKLVMSFLTVIAITGFVATIVGIYLIGDRIKKEAQNKVSLDLNSARQMYVHKLRDIEKTVAFTAMRKFAVIEAMQKGNRQLLLESLCRVMEVCKLIIRLVYLRFIYAGLCHR